MAKTNVKTVGLEVIRVQSEGNPNATENVFAFRGHNPKPGMGGDEDIPVSLLSSEEVETLESALKDIKQEILEQKVSGGLSITVGAPMGNITIDIFFRFVENGEEVKLYGKTDTKVYHMYFDKTLKKPCIRKSNLYGDDVARGYADCLDWLRNFDDFEKYIINLKEEDPQDYANE